MPLSKWWKCDLQVATPAWQFRMPSSGEFNLRDEQDRARFATLYMEHLRAKGIEVVALADHNSHEWIDLMKAAGARHGVIVFPGCEVTTGSGSDGIHLILIGDTSKTGRDFDTLLSRVLGFGGDFPRFHGEDGSRRPGSSPKTIIQILDELPQDYLVLAPHALNDNGIASGKTAKGDIRWRALHHHRLAAVDPGDCSSCTGDSFGDRFRRRQLHDFPSLQTLSFVATSDAYRLEDLGARFSWIRMAQPSLEALRQAFLDHEARVLCDWDSRLAEYPDKNPNNVRHAWIESIELAGLQNSRENLSLDFHPRLNVLIGGRGSGKSTVVAGLRQIYSTTEGLPPRVKEEAEIFLRNVLLNADLKATHLLASSQERQVASWDSEGVSETQHPNGAKVATTFKVQVVNQKELFERVVQSKEDKFAASRSFLSFVDQSIGFNRVTNPSASSWWRRLEQATVDAAAAMREYQLLKLDLSQTPAAQARLQELERQIAAFDAPEARARRETIKSRRQESQFVSEREHELLQWLDTLGTVCASFPRHAQDDSPASSGVLQQSFDEIVAGIDALGEECRSKIVAAHREGMDALERWRANRASSEWYLAVQESEADGRRYLEELRQNGIDPKAYGQLQGEYQAQMALLKQLHAKDASREVIRQQVDKTWAVVLAVIDERRAKRRELLEEVSRRSGRLRFDIVPFGDSVGWVWAVRDLLNVRSDAFLEDVPSLAHWLWRGDEHGSLPQRWALWRNALASNDFSQLAAANLRGPWLRKLQGLDEALRLRLATVIADDLVEMRFLRDGGDAQRVSDWQRIEEGSPGQRTAAMLGFVLHHGDEPLVLDQPEDDLDTEWISKLVVKELRASRWKRQIIVVTHNANIPVNGDAEQVIVLENKESALRVRCTPSPVAGDGTPQVRRHCGAIETPHVREDIQNIMEGGINAFIQRERKYNNEAAKARLSLPVLIPV